MAHPRTMRGVLLLRHGGLEQLEYRDDLPVPEPAAHEMLIRVGASAVNNTDINTRIGWYAKTSAGAGWNGNAFAFPRIQGADACGHVIAVGAGVESTRIGERVLVNPCFDEATYFGSERDGAFAEFAVVPALNALRINSTLSDAELASFPCSYSTAENLLARAGVTSGESVLITGASGGVGSAAVQLAARRGAKVIALAGKAKAAAVQALGAERVLDRDANLLRELQSESIDVVVDVTGGPAFPAVIELLRRGGRYACAGAIAGAEVALDLRTLYLKDLSLLGCTRLAPGLFANLVQYIERGEIEPVIGASYPLAEIAAAQTAFLAKKHVGKISLAI